MLARDTGRTHTRGGTYMSDSAYPTGRNGSSAGAIPRAVIHKKILDEARASPNASIEEIATVVSGASADFVEQVLEDYGDPAEGDDEATVQVESAGANPKSTVERSNGSTNDGDPTVVDVPDLNDLTDKQRRTLRYILDHPEATQAELAEKLDVTSATICNRVNNIEGFDWSKRREFVNNVFDSETVVWSGDRADQDPALAPELTRNLVERLDVLGDHVASLERHLVERPPPVSSPAIGPDLATKVIHACMASEIITEDEELEIVRAILSTTDPDN